MSVQRYLTLTAIVSILAGCSAAGAPLPQPGGPAAVRDAAGLGGGSLFVTFERGGQVWQYTVGSFKKPVRALHVAVPVGLGLDSLGRAYVAKGTGGISVFAAGQEPVRTIRPGQPFIGVAVEGSSVFGLAYASVTENDAATGAPIAVYKSGISISPAMAVDRFGTLYVYNTGTNPSKILEYSTPKDIVVRDIAVTGAPSLATDARGDLFVPTNHGTVSEYARGATTPFRQITIPGARSAQMVATDGLGNLYACASGSIYAFDGSTGALVRSLRAPEPWTATSLAFAHGGSVFASMRRISRTQGEGALWLYKPGATTPVVIQRPSGSGPIALDE